MAGDCANIAKAAVIQKAFNKLRSIVIGAFPLSVLAKSSGQLYSGQVY
jgi:hypothetical protein